MTGFFHAYDLRGKFPGEIGLEEAEKIGKAYGTFTSEDEVMVGRDGRSHAETVTEAFIQGIISTGTNVIDAGMVPTPVVYFGMTDKNIGSAAIVTASHNPGEYTGFKFAKHNGLAMSREGGMKEIEEIYKSKQFDKGKATTKKIDLKKDYIKFVKNKIGSTNLNVVINFGNGVTSVIGRQLFEELGCNVKTINENINGDFPNHLPAPHHKEAQKQLKKEMTNQDLGIIFDGDGDRAGFMLPKHGYIKEDELIALLSEEILQKKQGKILHDLRASKLVPETIKQNKGKPVQTRVGHTFFSEKIHSDPEIVFAAELSGHFYYPVYNIPWDDGLFTAALLTKIMSEKNIGEYLENLEHYPVSPELRIDCPHEHKKQVIEKMEQKYSQHEISTVDGIKIQFENGWTLIRPSNTEEKISVRSEAKTQKQVKQITEQIETDIKKIIKKT